MSSTQPALFVSHASSLQPGGGGVQRCTREYQQALTAAGYQLTKLAYVEDRQLSARLRRKLRPRPYENFLPPDFAARCLAEAERIRARWIFLNHGDTAPLAAALSRLAPGRHRFALLSHGLDSTDSLHEARIAYGRARPQDEARLGAQLFAELEQRHHLDVVFCLSQTDLHLEQWLGARRACWLPRLIVDQPLPLAPVAGRAGTVSTLNHPPNREGIELLASALRAHPAVTLRVVGGPHADGEALATQFPNLAYLGPLDDHALAAEAATWCCFANPIFCYPRGASTKLAVPLGWGLPVATTRAGARGYRWDEAQVPLPDTSEDLAAEVARLTRLADPAAARAAVHAIAALAPGLAEIAALIHTTLDAVR